MNICELCKKEIPERNLPIHPECAEKCLEAERERLWARVFVVDADTFHLIMPNGEKIILE